MAYTLQLVKSMENNKAQNLIKFYLSFVFVAITVAHSFSWAEVESRLVSCDLSNEKLGIKKNIKLYKDKAVEIDRDGKLFNFTFQSVKKINEECHLSIESNTNVDLIIPLDGEKHVRAKVAFGMLQLSGPCQVLGKEDKSTGENYVEVLREFYGDEVNACNDKPQEVLSVSIIPAATDDKENSDNNTENNK